MKCAPLLSQSPDCPAPSSLSSHPRGQSSARGLPVARPKSGGEQPPIESLRQDSGFGSSDGGPEPSAPPGFLCPKGHLGSQGRQVLLIVAAFDFGSKEKLWAASEGRANVVGARAPFQSPVDRRGNRRPRRAAACYTRCTTSKIGACSPHLSHTHRPPPKLRSASSKRRGKRRGRGRRRPLGPRFPGHGQPGQSRARVPEKDKGPRASGRVSLRLRRCQPQP